LTHPEKDPNEPVGSTRKDEGWDPDFMEHGKKNGFSSGDVQTLCQSHGELVLAANE